MLYYTLATDDDPSLTKCFLNCFKIVFFFFVPFIKSTFERNPQTLASIYVSIFKFVFNDTQSVNINFSQ